MTKTDSQVQRDVLAELAWEPSVDATLIEVDVCAGVVSLSGCVPSYTEKWKAEHAVERVGGVMARSGQLEVKLAQCSARTDADIASSAQNMIEWMSYLPVGSVYVAVEGGWVTLAGLVDWPFQKEGAEQCVASLTGVVGVSNQIELAIAFGMTPARAMPGGRNVINRMTVLN